MASQFPAIHQLIPLRGRFEPPKEIGIEIEMEGQYLQIDPNKEWGFKGDGSLRGREAIEYITNGPIPREDVLKTLNDLLVHMAKDRGYKDHPSLLEPSDRCGVHIHINCQDLTFFQTFNYIFLYLLMEQVLVGYCGESREGNMFCLRASDAEYMIDKMIECKKSSDLYALSGGGDELRYSSINPGALFKFGSLEFRALRTPNNLMEIEEWMRLLVRIKDVSLNFEEPVNFIERYSQLGENGFFDEIMGQELGDILQKKVPLVHEKILNGIRLVQDIAYTPTVNHPTTLNELEATGMFQKRGRRGPNLREMELAMPLRGGGDQWIRDGEEVVRRAPNREQRPVGFEEQMARIVEQVDQDEPEYEPDI